MDLAADLVPIRARLIRFMKAFHNSYLSLVKRRRYAQEEEIHEWDDITCSNYLQQEGIKKAEGPIKSLDQVWVTSIKDKLVEMEPRKLRASSGSSSCCIHRVPQFIYQDDDDNKNPYVPKLISIGPLHRGEKRLQTMEDHKWRSLRSVISRARDQHLDLERYLLAVKELETRARGCYSETIDLSSDAFVEMMVLDGCFIIDLLCKKLGTWNSEPSDPIFKIDLLLNRICNDLLILENQIPFFVLQALFDLTNIPTTYCLSHIALVFLWTFKDNVQIIKDHSKLECQQHLLHLFHTSLLPVINPTHSTIEAQALVKFVRCVTELQQAGIKFNKGAEKGSFLDISFRKGVIVIPPLQVTDSTNSVFLNLIAFEQCYRHCGSYITSYATFMDCLVNSDRDVGILCRRGIIDNWLGTDQEVADVFNKMTRDVIFFGKDFYLIKVLEEINWHYNTTWHVWRASLMRDYFNNPWAIISVIGAIVLLLLTSTESTFTVLSYFHKK